MVSAPTPELAHARQPDLDSSPQSHGIVCGRYVGQLVWYRDAAARGVSICSLRCSISLYTSGACNS